MKTGYVYIALTTILFSTMEIALKTVANQFNPIQLNLIRFFVGSLLLLPFALKSLKTRGTRLKAADFGFFAFTGLVGVVVSMTLYQMAIVIGKASIVAVIFSCNPIFVIPFAFLLLKEKIRRHTIVSMVVSVVGMVVIMNPFASASRGTLPAILLTVLSALAFAFYGVVGKLRSARYGGVATTCFSFLMASAEMLVLVLASRIGPVARILSGAGLGVFANIPIVHGLTLSSLPTLAYVSLCVTGLGYAFYFLAIEKTSASIAAIVFYIKPALAPVLALLLLGESIAPATLVGIAFIVAGSAVAFIGNARLANCPEAY
jgi:drug/metabolite transporter (DMT)-like permease